MKVAKVIHNICEGMGIGTFYPVAVRQNFQAYIVHVPCMIGGCEKFLPRNLL